MSALDSKIDDLYQRPLDEFIPARAALASELKGDDARRVKQLKKPTNAPWAVNQVYWRARPAFDRVLKSGTALRRAQITALEGRTADVRGATEAHRQAVSAAVAKAIEIARGGNVHPDRDALARTFEALSLASTPPESPGRLTQPLQPGGFEMLTGVEPAAMVAPKVRPKPALSARPSPPPLRLAQGPPEQGRRTTSAGRAVEGPDTTYVREQRKAVLAARAREREAAAARRRREAAIEKSEALVARARARESSARRAWDEATDELKAAEHALSEARRS